MSVVPLRDGAIVPGVIEPPNAELIAKCEALLDAARSGYLRAIATVELDRDRGVTTGWTGKADDHDMVAGVNMLAHRYMASTLDHGD